MEPQQLPAQPKLKTNLDTDFLKLIAIISMLIDHVGGNLFPQSPAFRWIGRLAFPIFAYCLTVGLLYTRDIKKYILRLSVFALISQPFYIFATHPWDWQAEWMNLNIFFTLVVSLVVSLVAMWGLHTQKWWLFVAMFLLASLVNFDYSSQGIILMLIFYFCRNKPAMGAGLYVLTWLPALWSGYLEDPLSVVIGGHAINWTVFGLLSVFPIFIPTHTGVKIPKWFFYGFYPAHLAVIGVIRVIWKV